MKYFLIILSLVLGYFSYDFLQETDGAQLIGYKLAVVSVIVFAMAFFKVEEK